MALPDYPATGYYYAVRLAGAAVSDADAAFREVSGLSMEMGVEEVAEGGENRFKHRLPTGGKYANLELKRGLVVAASPFFQWCSASLQGNFVQPITLNLVDVVLLDPTGAPLKTWNVVNAWPVKWSVSELNAVDGQVVIESIELSYQMFNVR